MEPSCKFCLEYQPPPGGSDDPVLDAHLVNCEDCQGQSMFV